MLVSIFLIFISLYKENYSLTIKFDIQHSNNYLYILINFKYFYLDLLCVNYESIFCLHELIILTHSILSLNVIIKLFYTIVFKNLYYHYTLCHSTL